MNQKGKEETDRSSTHLTAIITRKSSDNKKQICDGSILSRLWQKREREQKECRVTIAFGVGDLVESGCLECWAEKSLSVGGGWMRTGDRVNYPFDITRLLVLANSNSTVQVRFPSTPGFRGPF